MSVISEPKEGSVEYHKREYHKARVQLRSLLLEKPSFSDRLREVYGRVSRNPKPRLTPDERSAKVREHQLALLNLGFLAKREVRAERGTNSSMVWWWSVEHSKEAIDDCVSGRVGRGKTNIEIVLIAPSNTLPKWEELMRRGSDLPGQQEALNEFKRSLRKAK